jgi:vacuolar protein sorting-associated protein 13A/C
VDIDFKIVLCDQRDGPKRPDVEISGNMSDVNVKITPEQMKFFLELSQSIPAAFSTEPEEVVEAKVETELPDETVEPAKAEQKATQKRGKDALVDIDEEPEKWSKIDLVFKVGAVGLELIKGKENTPVGDVAKASLSKFSLNQTHLKLKMMNDNSLESELLVQSFTIEDTRAKGTNRFRKVMSLMNTKVSQQFMASVSISGGEDRHLTALLDIDSPRSILALEG